MCQVASRLWTNRPKIKVGNPKTHLLYSKTCRRELSNKDQLKLCQRFNLTKFPQTMPSSQLVSLHRSMVMSIEAKLMLRKTKKAKEHINALWIGERTNKDSLSKSPIWIAWSKSERRSLKWSTMTSSYTDLIKKDRSSVSRSSLDWMQVNCRPVFWTGSCCFTLAE